MVSEKESMYRRRFIWKNIFEQYQKHQSLDRIVRAFKLYQEVRIEHAWETSVLQSFSKIAAKN